ncbi:MAG: putative barnase inhibitor [Cypionkella sp.]|uniref:barstar family protein n=1 Tax=Cypionkella sp. TaxID=2811411 RepID=UPI00262BC48C|nr:barstar family protein [Cypionkella sp.]MDB5660615.1 putative barnase inhibitor [Cypionkella sp.]
MKTQADIQATRPAIQIEIKGASISSIAGFYREINRVFMAGEDWVLGDSLDALSDMLYGGYGVAAGGGAVVILWSDMAQSRAALGVEATRGWLLAKLNTPGKFDRVAVQAQLDALERGDGPSYFAIIESIFAEHPRFQIVQA